MSLIGSLLALMLVPLKAKPKPPDPAAELRAGNVALDHWREAYAALERENERLRARRDALLNDRTALLMRIGLDEQQWAARNDPASPYHVRPPRQAQMLQHQNACNQQMQALEHYGDWINCVPSRGQALTRGF